MTSDYERMREDNIKAFRELFKDKFGEYPGKTSASSIAEEFSPSIPGPSSYKRKRSYNPRSISSSPPRPSRRSARLQGIKPSTVSIESDEDEDEYERKTLKMKIKKLKNVTPRVSLRREIIPPEDIEEKDLEKICYKSAGKVYDAANGSTCHQCRQKTADLKSICRNKECVGIRGQFCGFCLHNRYGENVAVILKDPNWSCPPCRNICNCSICRRRKGKLPTGILVPEALSRGYSNVRDFLATVDEDRLIKGAYESDEDDDKSEKDEAKSEESEVESEMDQLIKGAYESAEDDNKSDNAKAKTEKGQVRSEMDEGMSKESDDESEEGEYKLLDFGDDMESWMKVIF